jgi:hypothetical protein
MTRVASLARGRILEVPWDLKPYLAGRDPEIADGDTSARGKTRGIGIAGPHWTAGGL